MSPNREAGPTHVELPENGATPVLTTSARSSRTGPTSRADRRGDRACRPAPGRLTTARPGRQRSLRRTRPRTAGVRPGPPRPGRGDVHGRADRRSRFVFLAVGSARDHGLAGFFTSPTRRVGRLRRRVRAVALEPDGRKRIIHIDTQPAEVDVTHARGRAHRRHRGHAPAAAGSGPARGHRRPQRASVRGARDVVREVLARPPRGPCWQTRWMVNDRTAEGDRGPPPRWSQGHRHRRRRKHKIWVAWLYQAQNRTRSYLERFAAMGICCPAPSRVLVHPTGASSRCVATAAS